MENFTFQLGEHNLEEELRCVICLTLPQEPPFQCLGCDSIMCKECSDRMGTKNCPLRCQNPNYGKVKPKTMMLFDCITMPCQNCNKNIKCLEFAKHQNQCGKFSTAVGWDQPRKLSIDRERAQSYSKLYEQMDDEKRRKQAEFRALDAPIFEPPVLEAPLLGNRQHHDSSVNLNVPPNNQDNNNQNNQSREDQNRRPHPNVSREFYFAVIVIGLIGLSVGVGTSVWIIKQLVAQNRGFQVYCQGDNLFEKPSKLCLISYGKFSLGIIAVGQVGVGIIAFGGGAVGLLYALGLGAAGGGVTCGKIAISTYVYAAIFGVGTFKVDHVSMGYQSIYSFLTKKSPYVNSSTREGNNQG